jgi:hypothetical protein
MSDPDPHITPTECLFDLVFSFMLPIFLASAGGDIGLARQSIIDLLDAYQAATAAELELVARIISFSHAAIDSLRHAMRPDLPDNLALRFRANAVALNRSAEACRKALDVLQARRADAERRQASQPVLPPHPTIPSRPSPVASAEPAPAEPARAEPAADPGAAAVFPLPDLSLDPAVTDLVTLRRNAQAVVAGIHARLRDPAASLLPFQIPPDPALLGLNTEPPDRPVS